MSDMNDIRRLREMTDTEVQATWDAIMELDGFDRAELSDEWQEDVYAEITDRGLRSWMR